MYCDASNGKVNVMTTSLALSKLLSFEMTVLRAVSCREAAVQRPSAVLLETDFVRAAYIRWLFVSPRSCFPFGNAVDDLIHRRIVF